MIYLKSIIWQEYYKSVFFFNFTKLQFLKDKIYNYTQKNIWKFGKIGVLVNFILQKLKSKHLSQLLRWEVNLRGFLLQFGLKRHLVKGGDLKKNYYLWSIPMFRPLFCQGFSPKGFLVLFNMPIYFRWRRICCSYDASIGLALFRNLLQDRPEWRIRRCNHAFQTWMWSW